MKKFGFPLMAGCLLPCLLQAQTQNTATNGGPSSINYAVIAREANSRQWVRTITQTNAAGEVSIQTNGSYTELATSLCYQLGGAGPWLDAVEQIDIVADGAQATQGRTKVHWLANANTPGGAVHLVSSGGQNFFSTVYGLGYWDTASGSNVLIAPLKDSQGLVVGSNRVDYFDAFQNVKADIEYIYKKAGLEQNIILRQQPPSPAQYGLNPQTTRLQVFTEFFGAPDPQKRSLVRGGVPEDTFLNFGDMVIGMGKAFSIPGQAGPARRPLGPVSKHWTNISGSDFLIEELPYTAMLNALQALLAHSSVTNSTGNAIQRTAALLPLLPRDIARTTKPAPLRVAKTIPDSPGVVMDYTKSHLQK